MSSLFADIFEAIRILRACKGTSEKEILNYVQERVGGCLSVNNVLKTVCTLNKLVDEGVLVKRGKRYSIPKPPPKNDDGDDMEGEENEDDCDEDNGDDDNMKDSCDDMGKGNDDDDDDDDDEDDGDDSPNGGNGDEEDCPEENEDDDDDDDDYADDDEDDDGSDDNDDEDDEGCQNNDDGDEDDDDDDDDCDDKMENGENKEEKKDECPENETDAQAKNEAGNGNSDANGGARSKTGNGELNCTSSFNNNQGLGPNILGTKKSKRASRTVTPKTETMAFCARDFMDSQYLAYSNLPASEAFAKMEDVMEEDQEIHEKSKEISKIFQARRRGARSKRSHLSHSNYRSRSPVKKAPTDPYQHRLALEQPDEIGPLNPQLFQGPGDMELDIEQNRHAELDFDLFRHRSPIGPPPPNTPGVHVNRKESCCSTQDKKETKPELAPEGINQCALKRHAESTLTMLKGKDKSKKEANDSKKEKHKREASHHKGKDKEKEKEKQEDDDIYASMCSVCEKKKKKKV